MNKPRSGDWTGTWVAEKIRTHAQVADVTVEDPTRLVVRRTNGYPDVVVRTTAVPVLNEQIARDIFADDAPVDFLVLVPSASAITGDAFEVATEMGIPMGRLRDIMSALQMRDVSAYRNSEFAFVERGLEQHSRVAHFDRVEERHYSVSRRGLPDISVVFLNEYELTAEHIREARERYGPFALLVLTNPNAKPTAAAFEVAEHLGCRVLRWGEFLSALHR